MNGRGLDLRMRLPEGVEGLEAVARAALSARLARGSVSLTLRLTRESGEGGYAVDEAQLTRVLAAIERVQERALLMGVTLAQPTAGDVLGQRGVVVLSVPVTPEEGLLPALLSDLEALLDDFIAARAAEGTALARVLQGQVAEVERLVALAAREAQLSVEAAGQELGAAVERLRASVPDLEPARLAQEAALLAVKADVTEEIDRLRAHVAAARDLLAAKGPAGRRLDFLVQEFGREANTLCSKASSLALTRIGLDLKAVIDQMREQVQNVE